MAKLADDAKIFRVIGFIQGFIQGPHESEILSNKMARDIQSR